MTNGDSRDDKGVSRDDKGVFDDNGVSHDAIETGETVQRVSRLLIEPRPGFGGRLKRRIDRRVLGNDLVDLSFSAWVYGFMQYVLALLGLATGSKEDKGG